LKHAQSASHWLLDLHPGLFGIALGLLSLSSAWRRLLFFSWSWAATVADCIQAAGFLVLFTLIILNIGKLWLAPASLLAEFRHPVRSAMLALLPVCILFSVILLLPAYPDWLPLAQLLVALSLTAQAILAWKIVSQLSSGQVPPEYISPALYLPVVPGGFVGAMAVSALNLPGFAMLLFGIGIAGWALLEFRILNRLFSGPLPLALRPTIGIEIAPATVGCLSVLTLWPQLPVDILMVLLGVCSGLLFAVLTRWRWCLETPFNVGFWSFSFPLAAMASCIVEAVYRGAWPASIAFAAVALVSAVVLFLGVRTLVLLVSGKLLPV